MTTTHSYQNAQLSPGERAEDLLRRMTPEEKVGQMLQLDGQGDLRELTQERLAGSLLHINGARANEAMDLAAATRLGIPLLIADDCIHGHSFWPGATIFPTQLAQASSWNETLIEAAARATAGEVACTGIHWTFSPVLCLTRDLRWGRVGETFGEDPRLIARLGEAMIRGYQGEGLGKSGTLLATAKHYAGYSETQGGRDASEADLSRRKLRSYFLPPFAAAARAGCMAFMTGYQSMEGIPSTANAWLLREVLRDEWGFEGLLVTDWDNVGRMVYEQRICASYEEAAVLAVRSGNDLIMATPRFREAALRALETGRLEESEIDVPVRRILRLKFRMGLFEDARRADPERQRTVVHCREHEAVNLELARESLVLLRNREDCLPLDPESPLRIAVVGPNADDPQANLGDWAGNSGQLAAFDCGHPRDHVCTVRDGLERFGSDQWEIHYARGCAITGENAADAAAIEQARKRAAESDVVVVVLGDALPLIGEYASTATLELQGGQVALLEALRGTGTPMVLVLLHSKPNVLPPAAEGAAAILEAFNPGMCGGRAIAEVLKGEVNPSGRLPVSVPYHVGQQPVYYAQVRGQHGKRYADLTQSPQFAFGEGLGYTGFELSDLSLDADLYEKTDTVHARVLVQNTGGRSGKAVVQLYLSDCVTSVTWVQKELKDFRKVEVGPGETRAVAFALPVADCGLVDADGRHVVEPGEFELETALSSRDDSAPKASFTVR